MNELIETAAQQATEHANSYGDVGDPIWFQFYNEKFAELIVHTACSIILHYTDVDEGVGVAKKHFGVK